MKRAFFTAVDKNNEEKFLPLLARSLQKFCPDSELVVFKDDVIKKYNDSLFFYRAAPIIAMNLMDSGYDEVCKLDADQIIVGDISDIWEGDFDVASVLNTNPREMKKLLVSAASIDPVEYMNCGLVVLKNKQFVKKWLNLCHSYHFDRYQYREQDLMNLMIHFGGWRVKQLDGEKGFYGLSAKGYWPSAVLKDKKIMIPKNDEWNKADVELKVIHFAGGNDPQKGNYRLYFSEEVCQRIEEILS